MILEFEHVTGTPVALAKHLIVSVAPNTSEHGTTIIRMANGDQHAVTSDYADVISGWNVQR